MQQRLDLIITQFSCGAHEGQGEVMRAHHVIFTHTVPEGDNQGNESHDMSGQGLTRLYSQHSTYHLRLLHLHLLLPSYTCTYILTSCFYMHVFIYLFWLFYNWFVTKFEHILLTNPFDYSIKYVQTNSKCIT